MTVVRPSDIAQPFDGQRDKCRVRAKRENFPRVRARARARAGSRKRLQPLEQQPIVTLGLFVFGKTFGYAPPKLSKDVPSLREKYVTVLTAVERRAEETYSKLLTKKKSGKKLTENERNFLEPLTDGKKPTSNRGQFT